VTAGISASHKVDNVPSGSLTTVNSDQWSFFFYADAVRHSIHSGIDPVDVRKRYYFGTGIPSSLIYWRKGLALVAVSRIVNWTCEMRRRPSKEEYDVSADGLCELE